MAPRKNINHIAVPRGRSREAVSFLAQLDDQSRRLLEGLRGITAAELEWQPKQGMNTIGMLLAHIAIVEVFWLHVAMERASEAAIKKVTRIGGDDDGMPMPAGGSPPRALKGRTLGWYTALLKRSRDLGHAHGPKRWPDATMDRFVLRKRRDGSRVRTSADAGSCTTSSSTRPGTSGRCCCCGTCTASGTRSRPHFARLTRTPRQDLSAGAS